jgi:hypothetical protein
MAYSRLRRFEEKEQRKRLMLAIVGSIGILLFIIFFGFKILVGFSVMVDSLHGATPKTTETPAHIQPPVLDPIPDATNSAKLKITGKANPKETVIVYLNDDEYTRVDVDEIGNFSITVSAKEGHNTISAKDQDTNGKLSGLSNVLSVLIKNNAPILEITTPDDNASVSGDDNHIQISGKTEKDNTVTINDRLVVVNNNGKFSYSYPLGEGVNTLTITATDGAGNQTKVERHATYLH